MSCAIVSVVYGVPLNEAVSKKIREWEAEDDERWTDERTGQCGFTTLYSASGDDLFGYCGVELCQLESYANEKLSALKTVPTELQKAEAERLVAALNPKLRKLAGDIDVYLVWHDS